MTEEKDLAQLKREAAARAKAEAQSRIAAKNAQTQSTTPPTAQNQSIDPEELKRLKREAVEKAKAEAQSRLAAKQAEEANTPTNESEEEKLKRLKREAVEKAKAEARAKLAEKQAEETSTPTNETEEEKLKRQKREAVEKAKAEALAKRLAASNISTEDDLQRQKREAVEKAKAAALAKKQSAVATEEPQVIQTSKNDIILEKYIKVIEEHVGKEVILQSYINFQSKEVPTIVIDLKMYFKLAQFLRFNEQLAFDSLVELHATDFESSIELYIYLYSFINKQHLVIKTQLNRKKPEIESITPIWPGANWPECEAYDLLGVQFKGHPYLHRILLGEDWIGHPLRKDYKAYDGVEV